MYFIYPKIYEKYLDGGCRRDLTFVPAHKMLWSAFALVPIRRNFSIELFIIRGTAAIVFSRQLENYKGAVLNP
jgi:hypothetical protein